MDNFGVLALGMILTPPLLMYSQVAVTVAASPRHDDVFLLLQLLSRKYLQYGRYTVLLNEIKGENHVAALMHQRHAPMTNDVDSGVTNTDDRFPVLWPHTYTMEPIIIVTKTS